MNVGVWALATALSAGAPAEPEPVAPAEETTEEEVGGVARLRGRVFVYGDRDPAAGARLIPKDGGTPIETDGEGAFSVDLPPGDHAFIVRAPGFDDLEVDVALVDEQDLQMEYFLQPSLEGERYRTVVEHQQAVAVSSTRLEGREIHEVPGTRGDPLSVVATLPGASRLAGFLPYIVVRGAAPGNTGYYLDGARVPILYHVAIGPSVIHPYFIDGVDFYPGGAPVRLGRFTSGLVEATTRPARRDRVHGEVDVRFTDAGGLVEVPISRPVLDRDCRRTKKRKECEKGDPRGALTLAGRYSYTAGVLNLVRSGARIQFWDYQARFDHDLGSRARYTAFAYGSYDDIGTRANGSTPASTFLRFNFHRLDNRVRQRLRNGGSATYAVVLGLDTSGLENYYTREYRVAPRIDYRIPTRRKSIQIGLGLDQEFQVFRATSSDSGDGTTSSDVALFFSDRFVSATGGYAELIFNKGKVEVRPGLRLDFYAQVGRSPYVFNTQAFTSALGADPRLLMREQVNDRWTLKQAIGLYHQPPTFPIPVPGIESFGFERGLQQNAQTSFGYEFAAVPGLLNVEQEAYVGYLSNLQDYELEQASQDPINELEDVITTVTGWAYGLETLIKLDPQLRVFGWLAYTLSRSTRNYEIGGHAPASWDQRHILNLVLGYRISQKWNFGGRVHYHTGRPWTARDENESQSDALQNRRNNARLPAYFQLDLRVERIWRWPKWQMSLALDVSNATYAREIFACTDGQDGSSTLDLARSGQLAAPVDPARGIVQCTPQGFRYTIPSLGLRARW